MALQDAIHELSVAFNDKLQVESCISGRSNNVYIIIGTSGTRRSLRVPADASAAVPAKRGVALLKQIKQLRPSLQVPDVVYEASNFTVLSYVDGGPLGSWRMQSVDQVKRIRLLDGLASFLFELWTFPTDSIPATSMYTFRYKFLTSLRSVQMGLSRIANGSFVKWTKAFVGHLRTLAGESQSTFFLGEPRYPVSFPMWMIHLWQSTMGI